MYEIIYESEHGPISVMDENGVTECIVPGDIKRAEELLGASDVQKIRTRWSPYIIQNWQEMQKRMMNI